MRAPPAWKFRLRRNFYFSHKWRWNAHFLLMEAHGITLLWWNNRLNSKMDKIERRVQSLKDDNTPGDRLTQEKLNDFGLTGRNNLPATNILLDGGCLCKLVVTDFNQVLDIYPQIYVIPSNLQYTHRFAWVIKKYRIPANLHEMWVFSCTSEWPM